MSAAAVLAPVRTRSRRRKPPTRTPLALAPSSVPSVPNRRTLPELQWSERRGEVLRPAPYIDQSGELVCGVNLTGGCAHACSYCFIRAYPTYPGDETVVFYRDTASKLAAELRERRKMPHAVYLSPSSDPFPPFTAVQAEAARVANVLAENAIESWFMTRGFIRPTPLESLTALRERVKVTVALSTLDPQLSRTLEPLAAPPRMRVKQIIDFKRRGIRTEVAVEPLIPRVTDTRENLAPLLDALARAGVDHITVGYVYLRQRIRENLTRELEPLGCVPEVIDAFAGGPVLPMGTIAPAKHLPRPYRQRGYALLMALAATRGITVRVNSLTNPDFGSPRPAAPVDRPNLRQMLLQYERTGK